VIEASLDGDCGNPVTTFTLTAVTQKLTQASFYVQYEGQCSINQDCTQRRCQVSSPAAAGVSSLSCSFPKPTGYNNKQYMYVLWQTTAAPGNRQYPLPNPAFIPYNFDCNALSSYTSVCNNGACACNPGEAASDCPTQPPTQTPPTSTVPVVNPSGGTGAAPPPTVPPPTVPPPQGPRLIFNDEFNKLDYSVWEHELTLGGDGNWCFQQYTNNRTNTFVRDGVLYIKPTYTKDYIGEDRMTGKIPFTLAIESLEPAQRCTGDAFYGCARTSSPGNYINPIQSAAIRTSNSFSFKYGRVEINAKLPRGDWIWPAMWLLPRWTAYGQWPMSGEIDIMESRGNAPGYRADGSDTFGSTLHWGPYAPYDIFEKTHKSYTLPNKKSFADDFHIFGLYWDATGLYTYIDKDSNKVLQVNWTKTDFYTLGEFSKINSVNPWATGDVGAPFDQEFYLILDVAVGGSAGGFRDLESYFPVGPDRPWKNDEHATKDFWDNRAQWEPTWKGDDVALKVDYVRVWQ